MGETLNQLLQLLISLPPSKKISMAFILSLVVAAFVVIFFWANQEEYQVLFNNLSPKDGGSVVAKLQEKKIPYKVGANGATVLVPSEKVYELRLALAGEGLPSGENVGFEIFDHTDFGTTKFVQELNYRRALQGELARTINQFKEVNGSRVFIVIPKESLFLEEKKPASASIQLDLRSSLPANKLAAIVHLAANAVEGLEPENVTVVDTKGRLIFKGNNRDSTSYLLSNAQLEYQRKVESEIRENVQTMLEGIVGAGKAIVRITAEIDYNKITLSEEEYDPEAKVVRSERNIEESTRAGENGNPTDQTSMNRRTGILPPSTGATNSKTKKDVATNYEINKITRSILKPAGTIKRLSVAAVIDGTYEMEKLEDGTTKKTYIPRSEAELKKFDELVKKAMGYNEDREDQITVDSISFAETIPTGMKDEMVEQGIDILKILAKYRKTLINLILIVLVFFFIVKPLSKSMKKIAEEAHFDKKALPADSEKYPQIPEQGKIDKKERVYEISKTSPERTRQLIQGWVGDQE